MNAEELKQKYLDLKGRSAMAYKAAEPERQALEAALAEHNRLEEEMEKLLDDNETEVIGTCEGCCNPIFDGDKHTGGEFDLCEECAPSYRDFLTGPENFHDENDQPITPEQAQQVCAEYVDAGGSLDDKMVR